MSVSVSFIGFLGFIFIGMTTLNRVLEGSLIQSGDVATLNNITVFRNLSLGELFSVPVPNLSFITEGLPRLIKFDYSYFGGNAGFIQYFLYSATFALACVLFFAILGLLYQYFSRAR